MNKKWQKLLCSTIAGIFFCKSVPVYGDMVTMRLLYDGSMHDYQAESIAIEVNGTTLSIEDMPPISLYDRTMVPARAVFEAMGAEVAWNEATQEVYIRKDKDIIVLQVDQTTASKNGVAFTMDVPAKVINERTMIPVRAVSEALGCSVNWDETTRTVSIAEQIQQTEPQPEETQPQSPPPQTETQKTYAGGGTGEIPQENIGITNIIVPVSEEEKQIFFHFVFFFCIFCQVQLYSFHILMNTDFVTASQH